MQKTSHDTVTFCTTLFPSFCPFGAPNPSQSFWCPQIPFSAWQPGWEQLCPFSYGPSTMAWVLPFAFSAQKSDRLLSVKP
ncbi:hypothetical protein llap_17646 [Limosa lapponica baueri]|uniref:Uncharacterized protein n=1 Tax=Limosa lapponica baueri TaxID=1758121 RepID=A0A2I0TE23_LIMLA|nr:hypothetical protein llap_17646 [Limosa lapponica baueri]